MAKATVKRFTNLIPHYGEGINVEDMTAGQLSEARAYVNDTANIPYAGKKFDELTENQKEIRDEYYGIQKEIRGTRVALANLGRLPKVTETKDGKAVSIAFSLNCYDPETKEDLGWITMSKYIPNEQKGLLEHYQSFGKTQRPEKFDRVRVEFNNLKKGNREGVQFADIWDIQHAPMKVKA